MKNSILFTGFEPWGDIEYNPSWDVAQSAAATINQVAQCLPVDFNVINLPMEGVVFHLGVAAARENIELERFAHNIKRVEGEIKKVIAEGPLAYETQFNIDKLIYELLSYDLQWGITESRDAGTFVCNALYYASLHQDRQKLFIHLPMMDKKEAKEVGIVLGKVCQSFLDDLRLSLP